MNHAKLFLLWALLSSAAAFSATVTFDRPPQSGSGSATALVEDGVTVTGNLLLQDVDGDGSIDLTIANGRGSYLFEFAQPFNSLSIEFAADPAVYGAIRFQFFDTNGTLRLNLLTAGAARTESLSPGRIFGGTVFNRIIWDTETSWCESDCDTTPYQRGGVASIGTMVSALVPYTPPVPEPTSLVLMALGVFFVVSGSRTIHKARQAPPV